MNNMNNINYITDFVCTYNLIENDFSDTNALYQLQLLQAFNLEIFDDTIINKITEQIYEKFKTNNYIIKLLNECNKKYIDDELTLFRFCFGYHTFYLMHSIICSLINETNVNEDKFNKLSKYNFFI